MATRYVPVPSGTTDVSSTLTQLYGYSFRESAGTAAVATVLLRKTDTNGDVVVAIELAADASETKIIAAHEGHGLNFDSNIYVDIVAGSVQGSIWGK